ncbi:MAG: hypothetical protein AABZ23_07130 [Deltaproteobacteria bacterium]
MKKWYLLTATAFLAAVGLATMTPDAEAIHRGAGGLVCGGCHTMHNAQGQATTSTTTNTLGGADGGSIVLLRADIAGRQEIHKLCLQCHASDGSRGTETHAPHAQTAPKVLLDSANRTWTQDTAFNKIGAGGDFGYGCASLATDPAAASCGDTQADTTAEGANFAQGRAHSVGATTVTPPGGDAAISAFSCTNCHDPHGVTASTSSSYINNYRMLRMIPTGSGGAGVTLGTANMTSWIGGVDGEYVAATNDYYPVDVTTGNDGSIAAGAASKKAIWPMYRGTLSGTAATDAANSNSYAGGSAGLARWCSQCHDKWHETNVVGNASGNDWKRHPVDNLLDDGDQTSGAAVVIINTANYDAATAGKAVPVADGAGSNRVWYLTAQGEDRVFCFSCHFAHGGPYNDLLRWNYSSAVGLGTQVGNTVASDRGCQLCHNRGGF